jgi:hypothetical protein
MATALDSLADVVLQQDEIRVVANLGAEMYRFDLPVGEELELVSATGVEVQENALSLPAMLLAVLISNTEQTEEHEVR